MDPDPRKKRRRTKHKRSHSTIRQPGSEKHSKSSRRTRVNPTSSFTSVAPSSAPISLSPKKQPAPVCRQYLLGLAGVILLILLGGGHNVFALSLSLLLPGIALILRPPSHSPGIWLDRMALAFLGVLLLSFLPQFYWPDPEWRVAAEEVFQINFPFSLSIQPWSGFEAWLSALAGFAWFYAASSWQINNSGRKWTFFAICLAVGILAAVIFWGNITGAKYPAAEGSTVFSFFPNRNQTANFLAVGGLAAFGYGMCALGSRQLLPLIGVVVAALSFIALVWGVSRAGVLLFFGGILIWYFLQLGSGRASKRLRLGLPLMIVAFSVFMVSNSQTSERVLGFLASPEQWSEDFRSKLAVDTLDMVKDAPLTGHGLGTFASIFPQYRDHSANHQRAVHPESDILWLMAEGGILALILLGGFVFAYFQRCRGLSHGQSGGYRLAALAAVLVFMLHSFADVAGHRPGTVYFAILFAALALPKPKQEFSGLSPRVWRVVGVILVLFGLSWGVAAISGLPLHSKVALEKHETKIRESVESLDYVSAMTSANKWVSQRPFDWRGYFQRATLTLAQSGNKSRAAEDFRRARFVEPDLGLVAYEEGLVWMPYDSGRTLSAWREVLFRKFDNREHFIRQMLAHTAEKPELRDGLARLSVLDPEFREKFLMGQSGDYFIQEVRRDLDENPRLAQYSRQQRTSIFKWWIKQGDLPEAEKFLQENSMILNRPWWLWSLLRKEQANFEDAVQSIRSNLSAPELPVLAMKDVPFERLKREFAVAQGDIMKGTALLQIYIQNKEYQKVLALTQAMIAAERNPPHYVNYWLAESYFHLNDFIECWYAYEQYLERVWGENE